jgi:hypothetical protein
MWSETAAASSVAAALAHFSRSPTALVLGARPFRTFERRGASESYHDAAWQVRAPAGLLSKDTATTRPALLPWRQSQKIGLRLVQELLAHRNERHILSCRKVRPLIPCAKAVKADSCTWRVQTARSGMNLLSINSKETRR